MDEPYQPHRILSNSGKYHTSNNINFHINIFYLWHNLFFLLTMLCGLVRFEEDFKSCQNAVCNSDSISILLPKVDYKLAVIQMKSKLVDAFISLLGAFGVFYPMQTMENFWMGITLGFAAAISVGLIIWFTVRKAREVTIPEALAYGYFGSFLEPMVSHTGMEAIVEVNGQTKRYPGSDIHFRIILPQNLKNLGDSMDQLESSFQRASIVIEENKKPFGIYIDDSDNKLVIADVPNTLRALITYLKREQSLNPDQQQKKIDEKSSKALEKFKDSLNEMIEEHKHRIDGLRKKVTIEQ